MVRVAPVLALLAAWQSGAWAGHEVSYYPAFYPSEISLTVQDPKQAAAALTANKLDAYLGAEPSFPGTVPVYLTATESLGGYVVVRVDPSAPWFAKPAQRCRAVEAMVAALSKAEGAFTPHPYPVLPLDADYLQHADLAQKALQQQKTPLKPDPNWKIHATGALARQLSQAGWQIVGNNAALWVEEVPSEPLLNGADSRINGWVGPPWAKEGWYRAYKLFAPNVDAAARAAVHPIYQRLTRGEHRNLAERFNLERRLVAALLSPCTAAVAGYTARREYFSEETQAGVENVGADGIAGLNAPLFIRTVKLKDFPWNGPLFLAMPQAAQAAWNPIAGFGDGPGRLIWSMIADDAFMMHPRSGGWIVNRMDPEVVVTSDPAGKIEIPADAIVPRAGTGVWQAVGANKLSGAKVVYKVLASPFLDDADMEPADVLYPYSFAFRWSGADPKLQDTQVAAATALVRERLRGVRVAKTDRRVDIYADIRVPRLIYTVEVYLSHGAGDPDQTAALAPPWSPVPWHVLALMEQAVQRGLAAFSESEARRRNVPWLDLARNPNLQKQLRGLVATLEKERFVPPALASGKLEKAVTPESAESRWGLLREFAQSRGHLLVTNGPYVLKKWDDKSVSFEVVRDFRYAIGLGNFNSYANIPLARVTTVKREQGMVIIEAELEKLAQFQREFRLVREPLKRDAARGFVAIVPHARYVLVGSNGKVVATDRPEWRSDGRFVVSLPANLPKDRYVLLAAVFADGNTVNATVGQLPLEIPGS